MARKARLEQSKSARSSRQFNRFYHSINPDMVFGTHSCKPSAMSGGSSEKTLKKLKGAALTSPFSSHVVTSAIGRGTTTPHSSLYRSRGSMSRNEMQVIQVSGGGTAPVRLVIRP